MPTLEPALDDISRDLAALRASSPEEPPTPEQVYEAIAKLRSDIDSLIADVQQLYNSAVLVTAEFSSPGLAADSWKDLREKFLGVFRILERTLSQKPLEYSVYMSFEHAIGVVRSIVNQANQQYQSYSEKALDLAEIPESFFAGLEDIRAGRVVDMEQALNEPPPPPRV